jgi:hypothetical protein
MGDELEKRKVKKPAVKLDYKTQKRIKDAVYKVTHARKSSKAEKIKRGSALTQK